MNMPFNKRSAGFTLIEVMVALTIIAIALSSLIKASASHTRSAAYLRDKTLAHYVAMNAVAQLQVDALFPNLGSKNKSIEMAGHEWYWTRLIEKVGDETDSIRSVKITVYSDENRARQVTQIQAFIAKPTPQVGP